MPQTIIELIKQFGKQPGCERYTADGERIKMLSDYLWCRQLTPGLTFEVYLQRFQPLADFDPLNRKHPEDAIHYFCPRAAKQATDQGMPQWNAKEVVDFVALYVDMIREAEATGQEPPMTLQQFLEQMAGPYKQGAFAQPAEPAAPREPKAKKTKAPKGDAIPAAPVELAVGQRVVYTMAGTGRQIRGTLARLFEEGEPLRQYADVTADDGEAFNGVNRAHVVPSADPPARTVDPRAVKETQKLWIPKAQGPQVLSALAMDKPIGNVDLGGVIYPFMQGYSDGRAASINIVNGQTGPYVDAQLLDQQSDEVLADCAPRKNIVGEYTFPTDAGVYVLNVCIRE